MSSRALYSIAMSVFFIWRTFADFREGFPLLSLGHAIFAMCFGVAAVFV